MNNSDPSGMWTHAYCIEASASFVSISGQSGVCAANESSNNTGVLLIGQAPTIDKSATLENIPEVVKTVLANGLAGVSVDMVEFNTNAPNIGWLNGGEWLSYGINAGVGLGKLGINGTFADVYNPSDTVSGAMFGGGVGLGIGSPVSIGGTGTFYVDEFKYDGGATGDTLDGIMSGMDLSMWLAGITTQYGEGFAQGTPSWVKGSSKPVSSAC